MWPYIAVLATGALGGYILKDLLTTEIKSEVTIRRPKIKGRGNKMELDQVVDVTATAMPWKERRAARKAKKDIAEG